MKVFKLLIKKSTAKSEEVDGGVIKRTVYDAPKVIYSTALVAFECRFSTRYFSCEDIEKDIFRFKAVLEGGNALVYVGKDKRTENADFMDRLRDIIARHKLAEYNGIDYFVSGISDEYGATVSALYESGERIYAADNQSCFLPMGAMKELIALFKG